ncbi:uncharacterized protein LOC118756595 [Rhagoletis pomonella]|uniref:uncharacterized protein LOC118756595 n=1 Tax=Rhagoletis pomonella TaxID=28610 RepID=UPI00177BB372|nr:uncharacterized protein LOC118756595 [Rhagoletis pomonella]
MRKFFIMAEEEGDKKWTHAWKTLLIDVSLSYEEDFRSKRKKRSVLWEKVLREMKDVAPELPFSRDDVTRKFLNFMVTYKRIKKRNNTSGEAATPWEFFELFDNVYGSRVDITVPEEILDSLYNTQPQTQTNIVPSMVLVVLLVPVSLLKKRARCEVLHFLRTESIEDKEVMKEFLECEKEMCIKILLSLAESLEFSIEEQ